LVTVKFCVVARVMNSDATSSFHCCAAHRDLHSFPTRRSSDLLRKAGNVTANGQSRRVEVSPAPIQRPGAVSPEYTVAQIRERRRSEEHTSELQSPDHLVCRLLLEKKKRRPSL